MRKFEFQVRFLLVAILMFLVADLDSDTGASQALSPSTEPLAAWVNLKASLLVCGRRVSLSSDLNVSNAVSKCFVVTARTDKYVVDLSALAAEAKRPSIYLKAAFKTVYWRFALFFIGGALAVGILIPYNDPTLVAILGGAKGSGTAAGMFKSICLFFSDHANGKKRHPTL